MAVARALGLRHLPGEEPPPIAPNVTVEGDIVSVDGSNVTLT